MKKIAQVMGLHFDFAGGTYLPKSGQVAPPLDCDVSTENAKTVLSITCTGLKKGHCSNCQKVELLE